MPIKGNVETECLFVGKVDSTRLFESGDTKRRSKARDSETNG